MLGLMMERLCSARTGARMYRRRSLHHHHHHHRHLLLHQHTFTGAAIYACSRPSLKPPLTATFTPPTTAARHSLSTDNYEL
jgi:hypothetical protein